MCVGPEVLRGDGKGFWSCKRERIVCFILHPQEGREAKRCDLQQRHDQVHVLANAPVGGSVGAQEGSDKVP